MSINKVVNSYDEAVAGLFDGAILLIGGFGPANGTPSNLIRAVHKKGNTNLTICMNTPGNGRQDPPPNMPQMPPRKSPPNYDNGGLLIQNDQVTKVISAFPGTPMPGFPSPLHDRRLAGKLEVEMVPQGTMAERMRAAKTGIPAFYTPTGPGTKLGEGKEIREFNGVPSCLEFALKGDFSLVRAHTADRRGNLTYQGTSRNFNATMAGASTVTIAEVDYLVEVGEISPECVATPGIYVDIVVVRKNPEEGI